jgi:hypothetical protein
MAVLMMVSVALIGAILLTSLQTRSLSAQVNNSEQNSDSIRVTGNIITESKNTEENWFSNPLKFLSHPFILVLIGSTASGLIIAIFARQWERKQKNLELDRQERQQKLELDRQERQKTLNLTDRKDNKNLNLILVVTRKN